jgi:methyltransferase-like protein
LPLGVFFTAKVRIAFRAMNQSTDKNAFSTYDEVPYPGHAYPETHPDLLASIGVLAGMEPPPVRSCRVLEIGCGDGSNIIPMAVALPNAKFVGIDLAERPIRQAQAIIDRLAIRNITVQVMDLLEFTSDFGRFDYIVAHGFYSWVPPHVQTKLLSVCQQQLTQNGIAFISYNTFPAAHFRRASRDIMLFHLKTNREPGDPVRQAKSIIGLIVESVEGETAWKTVLRDELTRIGKRDENVVCHDELSEVYSPVYFSDFIASAALHGLQFLQEAFLNETISSPLKPELERTLREYSGGDLTAYHQYLDFIRFRGFRRTLLCRSEIPLRRDVQEERLPALLLASPLRETSRKADGKITFKIQQEPGSVETDHSIMIGVIQRLEQIWPRAESFADLLQHVITRVPSDVLVDARSALMEALVLLISKTLVQCRTQDLPVPANISNKPIASPLARLQAENGTMLTTLMHTHIEIEDQRTREFLRLLDGSHDRRALASWLRTGVPGTSVDKMLKQVNDNLQEFRRLGLLFNEVM